MKLGFRNFQRCFLLFGLLLIFSGSALAQGISSTAPAPDPPTVKTAGSPRVAAGPNSPSSPTPAEPRGYLIYPGDTLDIAIYDSPDLSEKVTVSTSGDIYLPLVKNVHVADLTIEAAQTQIETAFKQGGFLQDPLVRVAVTDYAHGVNLIGEVVKPGTYPVPGSKRLSELLAQAGGTAPAAGQVATIRRWPDGRLENVALSTDPGELLKADVWVNQGDTVVIGRAGVVYIVGEVYQPSGFAMQDRTEYTVLKLVAMAHGATKSAKLSEVRIVRKSPAGVTEIPVSLDKIMANKAPDVGLLPDDIVFVPTNKARNAAVKTGEIALGLASAVAIVGFQRF